jgi:hypothetical protein
MSSCVFLFRYLLLLAQKFSPVLLLQDGVMLLAYRGEFEIGMENRYRLAAVEMWGDAPARISLVKVMSDGFALGTSWRTWRLAFPLGAA